MSQFKNWTEYHHRINLIFHAIVAVTMLPFVWLYLEIDTGNRSGTISDPVVNILFIAVCVSLVGTAFLFRKRQLKDAVSKESLREKLGAYLKLQIVSFALLEGAALISTIAFFLTASYLFVVVYIAVLFLFSLTRPQLERTNRDLLLKKEDRNILSDRLDIP